MLWLGVGLGDSFGEYIEYPHVREAARCGNASASAKTSDNRLPANLWRSRAAVEYRVML